MTRTSKRIVDETVATLNDLLDADPRTESLFVACNAEGLTPMDAINAVLAKIAEGAAIVMARETDGTLVGFVPRRQPKGKVEVDAAERTEAGEPAGPAKFA